jgi:uncharacterized surface protein with fasciclin (FAS1) repeats
MALKKSIIITTLVSMLVFAFAAFVPSTASARSMQNQATCTTSIVDVALAANAETGEFSTFIAALSAARLVKTFDCREGKTKMFTVFAPTDAAFAKLGLNKDNVGTAFDKGTLRSILLYHVVKGQALYAADVVTRSEIRMWKSGTVGVEVNDEGAFLLSSNDPSKIIATDIAADNGVIHVIDTVLLP